MNLNKDVMKQLTDQLEVVNHNGYLTTRPINKMDYTWDVEVPKKENKGINPQLIGNWYLYSHILDGSLYITKDKPILLEKGLCSLSNPELSGWLDLDSKRPRGSFGLGEWDITSEDFLRLKLPRVPQGKVIEIEIMPSGNVYFYDYEP